MTLKVSKISQSIFLRLRRTYPVKFQTVFYRRQNIIISEGKGKNERYLVKDKRLIIVRIQFRLEI